MVSALVEFGSALHVLRDPGHHGADAWAAGVGAAMSPRLATMHAFLNFCGVLSAGPHATEVIAASLTQTLAAAPSVRPAP